MAGRSMMARTVLVALVALTMTLSMCLTTGLEEGEDAPDFSINDVEGISHSLDDYSGKVLVIEFFATWCTYCTDQLPEMMDVRDKYKESEVSILMVDNDDRESKDKVADYRVKYDIPWPVAHQGGSMAQEYLVDAIPTTVVIDQEGQVQYYHTGSTTAEKLEKAIDELV